MYKLISFSDIFSTSPKLSKPKKIPIKKTIIPMIEIKFFGSMIKE
jgi:hypothetical protein